ncbi:MAG: PDZ domain-containing protein [Bradymonadales bacterium]|nr:PDZ domain-containing protein [Bradymonadales bacterium]
MARITGSLRNRIRYLVALIALGCGLIFSIVQGDRGWLLPAPQSLFADVEVAPGGYDLQALNILNRALLRVEKNYVEPGRIQPSVMLVYALNAIQEEIPQVVARFDRDIDEQPTQVILQVDNQYQQFDLQSIGSLWELVFRLRGIFRFVQENLSDEDVDLRLVEYAAINGLLQTLDPHSVLLSPKVYQDMMANNRGSFGGLGIVISIRNGQLTIISPISGTPAARAGLRAGDRIVKIGEESTINMSIEEAVSRLRGDPGTSVSIEVLRDGWSVPHEFTITREIINIQSVKSHALGDGIGYVQITNFQGNTHPDLVQHLNDLRQEMGELRGLVLDLRDNPGGLLEQAILVADTFLAEGIIVATVGEGQRLREEKVAVEEETEPPYPMVVLVSAGSASASEIVAGALQNHRRALLVGERTFGKGTVQVLYEFQDGSALKLTIAQYLTPGDVSIQSVGIVPDIRTVPMTASEEVVDLYPHERVIREGDLDAHLDSELALPAGRSSAVIAYYREPEPPFDPNAIEDPDQFEIDFDIELGRRLLLAVGESTEAAAVFETSEAVRAVVEAEQMDLITQVLEGLGVDWSEGTDPGQPTLEVSVATNWPENQIPAGETVHLTVSATNVGSAPLHRVWALSESDYTLFDDREFPLGLLEPGSTRSWTVPISVPVEEVSRLDQVRLSFRLDEQPLDRVETAEVFVQGRNRPHFAFTYQIVDTDQGNGDGLLQLGEGVQFLFTVSNLGKGDSSETLVYIKNEVEAAILLEAGRESWPEGLASGESRTAQFQFQVRHVPEDEMIRLEAAIYDTVFQEFTSRDLVIPLHPDADLVASDSGLVRITQEDTPIYAGAEESTPVLARADRGDVLVRTGRLGDWVRVSFSSDRFGWVQESATSSTSREGETTEIQLVYSLQPPLIRVEPYRLWTDFSTFHLTGLLRDNQMVSDYYLWVAGGLEDDRGDRRKVNYVRVERPEAAFEEDIPLFPGINQITLIARDSDHMSQAEILYIYRRTPGEAVSNVH